MTQEEKKSYAIEMANTIWKSLFCSVDIFTVCSWGVDKRTATYYKEMPALQFQVNGLIHKGAVIVAYNEGSDYFEAYFFNKKNECVKTIEDICFDDLGKKLDEVIEKPETMDDETYNARIKEECIKDMVCA